MPGDWACPGASRRGTRAFRCTRWQTRSTWSNCARPRISAAAQNDLLAEQPGSNPVGSGSEHIDCSIWAQLQHPTGILVRFGVAFGKKTRRPCVSCRPDQSMGRWTPLCNSREDLSAAHPASLLSLNFKVQEDNGWHGARVASACVVSQS